MPVIDIIVNIAAYSAAILFTTMIGIATLEYIKEIKNKKENN